MDVMWWTPMRPRRNLEKCGPMYSTHTFILLFGHYIILFPIMYQPTSDRFLPSNMYGISNKIKIPHLCGMRETPLFCRRACLRDAINGFAVP